jgi:hypothetical protein
MPRYDRYHDVVRQALIKEGWTITDDPFVLRFGKERLYADLGAEKTYAAEKGEQKIVVEIKVFGSASLTTELERAVGQYGVYRTLLKRQHPHRMLYLAVPYDVYADFFQWSAVQEIIIDHQLHLLIFEPETQEIIQWIN